MSDDEVRGNRSAPAPRPITVSAPTDGETEEVVVEWEGRLAGPFLSVGNKLAGATIALMAVVTAIVYIKLSAYQRENLLAAKEMAASAVTTLFADWCAAPVVFGDDGAITDALARLSRNDSVASAAVWSSDPSGSRVARLAELGTSTGELTRVPPLLEMSREPEMLVLSAPVRSPDARLVGAVVLRFSLARENAAIHDVRRRTLLVSAAIAAGITALLLIIARLAIVRPLGKLVVAANKIERGDSSEIDVRSNDEIGRLSFAFRRMARAIRSREARIRARNSDMRLVLDNVEQGFLTLDSNGRMSEERSRVVDQWFGPAAPGMRFWEFLGRTEPQIGEWFELVWTSIHEDILPIELCLQQLPRVMLHGDRWFEFAYRVIQQGERLDKVLVVITEVTAQRTRERAEVAQRDTMNMFQHIMSDRSAFEEFFAEAHALVENIRNYDGSNLDELKRHIHTLKGTCAVYGIESVAGLCHELENELETGTDELAIERKEALVAMWSHVTQVRAQFSRDGGVVIDRDEYAGFVEDLRARVGHEQLLARFLSWQLEPASKRMELVAEQMKQLASRLGKGDVRIQLETTKLRLPPKKWAPFWAVFAHVLRNAIDHGIETPEQRAAAGKPAVPTIWLSLAREDRDSVITIRDDGRGIDWDEISRRARDRGLPHATASELEAALFAEGVSSRENVTATSGRGIGLAAVRETVRNLGGRIVVWSEAGLGTAFRFHLPAAMLADDVAARTTVAPPPN